MNLEVLTIRQLLLRAMTCRCPRCGQGALFHDFLTLKPSCAVCKLPLAQADSGDGPAVILTFVLGFLLVPPILVFALHSQWPMWLHALVWTVVILGATLGSVRPAKALMVGLQFRHRRTMFEEKP